MRRSLPAIFRCIRLSVVVTLCLPLAATGCGGGVFGGELSTRPKPTPLARSTGGTLSLPQDAKFSITLAPSQESPGLEGSAESDSTADEAGDATAAAKVDNGGTASARFQLGHGFENDLARQVDLDFVIRCGYALRATAGPDENAPGANVTLSLFALDSRNRQLHTLSLVDHSTSAGDAESQTMDTLRFSLTLGPGEEVDVYLAGSVDIDTQPGSSAAGSLELRGLEMEVTQRSAPEVRTVSDEQG